MILYLPGLPVSRWYCRASLMAASVTSEPPHWNLTARQVAGGQLGEQVGQLHGDGVGAVHRRREVQRVELLADGVDDAAVVVADRDDVDAGQGVEVALAGDVPVVDAVGLGHDERVLSTTRPSGRGRRCGGGTRSSVVWASAIRSGRVAVASWSISVVFAYLILVIKFPSSVGAT